MIQTRNGGPRRGGGWGAEMVSIHRPLGDGPHVADTWHRIGPMAPVSQRVIASGDSFERHVEVEAPCVLAFKFHVDPVDAPLTFSVALRSNNGKKQTRLLPAANHSELSGEVLLPTPGKDEPPSPISP